MFVNAGNIWLYRDNPDYQRQKPGGRFSREFLSELAVGAGFGLRFDLPFRVLRTYMVFPIRKPWLAKSERWIFKQLCR